MSRLEFRAAVADARPPSAWMLVTVAGATLWITEQLAAWAIAVQVAAIVFSLLTRRSPHAWQTSDITLNIGMFGIVGATIALALQGNPATVSLAHFAAMTSGLQLLDTRPRKSEFLLVALALFQVILAANLTDSVLFPPLLTVFLVATTWTLLVHTLRSEAIEAAQDVELSQAIGPGLLRMTFVASAISIAIALVLFVLLPRLRISMIQGGVGSFAVSGFSDEVELGTLGRIRQDQTVVLRVETLEGEPPERALAYWRGLAFDAFDGRRWAISPISELKRRHLLPGTPRFGVDLNGGVSRGEIVQRVIREPVEAGVVFGLGTARRVEGPLHHLEIDVGGGVYAPSQARQRVRYSIWTTPQVRDEAALRRDRVAAPRDRAQPPRRDDHYLKLPELDPAIGELAAQIVAGAESDSARALALERWLRVEGRYTDDPPDLRTVDGHSPIERFLLEGLAGHCEYFASAMIVMARSVGLPARLVNGFAGGRVNRIGGFVELARSDAHAWVEVHYEAGGWVLYDPTPPDLRLRAATALSLAEQLAELRSVLELWWFQRVVDFDSSDQIRALKSAWGAWRAFRSTDEERKVNLSLDSDVDWSPADLPWLPLGLGAAALGLLLELRRRRARRRRRALPPSYARALRLLARRGLRREPVSTARAFAARAAADLPPAAAGAFSRLTESYLAERFGRAPASAGEAELRILRESG
ncbi:MAG: DUF3488 and transglutaminase-like domain-containing protein [Proteobacteria bacterium]|nr:DUF3488 and transglutaminase-like domain-containing protein [Pseudomonadota bacterium]